MLSVEVGGELLTGNVTRLDVDVPVKLFELFDGVNPVNCGASSRRSPVLLCLCIRGAGVALLLLLLLDVVLLLVLLVDELSLFMMGKLLPSALKLFAESMMMTVDRKMTTGCC